ncbi:MAG: FprA family A-type flavoprotein [Clostridiales Family XIII bacterium]|jgi:flavorubredoxin|nr:FprA family A-type flavoprotein [Clostridiales Family XIII bacterium]
MLSKKIKEDFWWIGNLDPDLRVFDVVMQTEFGTTYNSYVLKGSEKTVIFEGSKARFAEEYLEKLGEVTSIEQVDALIVDHTEPDHAGAIEKMLELKPDLLIVGTTGAINFLKEIVNRPFESRVVKAGDEMDIGGRTLTFLPAPNLHWPDTMFTWIEEDGILVTCDCFGSHYSDEGITNENLTSNEDYLKAALYYFDNILGPFKSDVLNALGKIKDFDIKIIATGHGPVLTQNPGFIIDLYKQWCSDRNPNAKKTVVIPYVSAYGYTAALAGEIAEGIRQAGDIEVRLFDMVSADADAVLSEILYADGFLLGTPTMVGEALPPIWNIAAALNAKLHGGKFASAFGSYGWSGEGVPHIMERLHQLKLNIYGEGFRVRFKPDEEQLRAAYEFGVGFGESVRDGKLADVR